MRYYNNSSPRRMLKKSTSLSCSFGLFGLSGLFGLNTTNQMDQTDQITRQTGLVTCRPSKFSRATLFFRGLLADAPSYRSLGA
jgi:hypothetical protein